MMPGVVAGFPKGTAPQITLVSQRETGQLGPGLLEVLGYSLYGALGSLEPVGASALPGAPPAEGASGEILEVLYERHSAAPAHRLVLTIRGSYLGVPFNSVKIGSTVVQGFVVIYQDSSQTQVRSTSLSTNPIPAGSHDLVFS